MKIALAGSGGCGEDHGDGAKPIDGVEVGPPCPRLLYRQQGR